MNFKNITNYKFKIYVLFIIGYGLQFSIFINVNAQQIPFYSQYTFSPFVLNPAAAGADGYTSIILTNRNQWLGIEGSPRVSSASIQTRIVKRSHIYRNKPIHRKIKYRLRSGKVGIGFNAYNYHAGQIDQTGAQLTYAYHIFLFRKSQLSMGFSIGFLKYKINTDKLILDDMVNDPVYNNLISLNIPDANAGIYYSDKDKYLGLSVLQLLQASVNFGNVDDENFRIYRQYYMIGGYKFNMNSKDIIESSIYLKFSEQLRFQLDASVKYIYNSKFWISLGYRSGLTFVGSTGLSINKFHFGYAYDYSPKGLLNYSYGSHEVIMALKFGENVRRYKYLERY